MVADGPARVRHRTRSIADFIILCHLICSPGEGGAPLSKHAVAQRPREACRPVFWELIKARRVPSMRTLATEYD